MVLQTGTCRWYCIVASWDHTNAPYLLKADTSNTNFKSDPYSRERMEQEHIPGYLLPPFCSAGRIPPSAKDPWQDCTQGAFQTRDAPSPAPLKKEMEKRADIKTAQLLSALLTEQPSLGSQAPQKVAEKIVSHSQSWNPGLSGTNAHPVISNSEEPSCWLPTFTAGFSFNYPILNARMKFYR